jgi:hypothetical protein
MDIYKIPSLSHLFARFPRREEVERSNSSRLSRLKTQREDFYSIDGDTIQDPTHREKLLSSFMASRLINLRVDAQVMLTKNVDETLVNESMGHPSLRRPSHLWYRIARSQVKEVL